MESDNSVITGEKQKLNELHLTTTALITEPKMGSSDKTSTYPMTNSPLQQKILWMGYMLYIIQKHINISKLN